MQILYCDKCGKRVPEKDLSDGAAVRVEEKVFCAACKPAPVAVPSNAVAQSGSLKAQGSTVNIRVAGLKETSGSLAIAKAGASARAGVSKRPGSGSGGVGGTAEPESKNTLVLAGIGGGVVMLVLGIALLGHGGDHPSTEPKTSKSAAKTFEDTHAKTVSPPFLPLKNDPPAKTDTRPVNPEPARPPVNPDKTQEADPEKLAGDAFDVLVRFEGVGADDKDGKLKRIEEFLSKYGDTMVSVRARKLMNDIKEPPKPPPKLPEKKTEVAEAGPAPDSHDADEPSSAGWQVERGPFDFENDAQEFQGDGSPMEQGTFKGRKCIKITPGPANTCRGYRPGRTAASGFRIKFRYYAHNLENLEILFGIPNERPRKNIQGLVQDQWAWATMSAEDIGAHGEGQHVEFGGKAKDADSFLLLDDVRWEKK